MVKRVQHVRHDTSGANAYTGLQGEITMDYGAAEIRLHDGTTLGGNRVLNVTQNDARYIGVSNDVTMASGKILSVIAGSVSAPGLAISGDSNTGMYAPAADQLALTLGGTQRLLLTSSLLTIGAPLALVANAVTGNGDNIPRAVVQLASPVILDTSPIVSADRDKTHIATAAKAYILPAANAVANGWSTRVKNGGAFVVTVARAGSDTIDAADTSVLVPPFTSYEFVSNGTSKWYIIGRLPGGSVIQRVTTDVVTQGTGTTTIPGDDTIPQITEGTEVITRAITPFATNSRLRIKVTGSYGINASASIIAALFQDATSNALQVATVVGNNGEVNALDLTHEMAAGTVSSTTFRQRVGPSSAATISWNGTTASRLFGGIFTVRMEIEELLAAPA